MNDKELLELAAKAAGIEIETRYEEVSKFRGLLLKEWKTPGAPAFWNPLTDDGDALRLSIKLEIDIIHAYGTRTAVGAYTSGYAAENTQDTYAATRRAITRVAAEIGKNLG